VARSAWSVALPVRGIVAMRNDEEAPRPLRPVGQRSQQLVGRYFDENAGRTGNPIPTIIVGDHVRPGRYGQKINHYTLLRTIEDATLPPHPAIEDLCQLPGPSRHEGNGGCAYRPGRQPSGQCCRCPGRLRQQWCGAKLLSILVVPGCSTTIIDQPSSVGRMQP